MILAKRLKELGKPPDWAYEMIFAGLIGGIVGSRIDFLIQNWSEVSDDLLGNLFSGSGLVWYGGRDRRRDRRDPLGALAGDALAPAARHRRVPLALGYAVGRIGCQLSGDGDYGEPWDGPWAMAYPDGTVPTTEEVHPTPIYEALAMGVVAFVLWRLRDRFRPGILFALYLVLAGLERFLVEFVRRNDDGRRRADPAAAAEPRNDRRRCDLDRGDRSRAGTLRPVEA